MSASHPSRQPTPLPPSPGSILDPASNVTVYFEISPCSIDGTLHELQVKVSLRPGAANAESEFLRRRVPVAQENALQLVREYIVANGVQPLLQKAEAWEKERAKYAPLVR